MYLLRGLAELYMYCSFYLHSTLFCLYFYAVDCGERERGFCTELVDEPKKGGRLGS